MNSMLVTQSAAFQFAMVVFSDTETARNQCQIHAQLEHCTPLSDLQVMLIYLKREIAATAANMYIVNTFTLSVLIR